MSLVEKLVDLNQKRRVRISIIGDVVIDDYRECACDRISPEGPHPVLRELRPRLVPGGAANTARQLTPWNADIQLLCPISDGNLLNLADYNNTLLCAWVSRWVSNPTKIRHQVNGRTLFRLDNDGLVFRRDQDRMEYRATALNFIRKHKPDAVIVSDYAKGTVDEIMAQHIGAICDLEKIPLIIDSKNHESWWEGRYCVQVDLARAKGRSAFGIRKDYNSTYAVLTRSSLPPCVATRPNSDDPFTLADSYESWTECGQIGPPVRPVSVSGAGDHFAAILALSLAHGLGIHEAATLAHESGCVYVTRPYNEPVLPHELQARFDPASAKIRTAEEIDVILNLKKSERVVFANGVFDCLHAGHLATLEYAKSEGGVLVVAVNSDDSVLRVKQRPPVVPGWQRARVLAGLSCVDFVVVFDEDTPEAVMRTIKPHVLVKGYDNEGDPNIPGRQLVNEVRFGPMTKATLHTSDMLKSYHG